MSKIIKVLMDNQDKLMVAGAIIGSNIGVYTCIRDNNPPFQSFSVGIAVGGIAGG